MFFPLVDVEEGVAFVIVEVDQVSIFELFERSLDFGRCFRPDWHHEPFHREWIPGHVAAVIAVGDYPCEEERGEWADLSQFFGYRY